MDNDLRKLREEHGVTQAELARAIGITRQTVIAVERQHYDPSLELAFKFAKYFDCTVDEMFQPDVEIDGSVRDSESE